MNFTDINGQNLSGLEKLLKLCRKQGVTELKVEGLSISFGELPEKRRKEADGEDSDAATDGLTPEQLMFYSVGGTVDENQQG